MRSPLPDVSLQAFTSTVSSAGGNDVYLTLKVLRSGIRDSAGIIIASRYGFFLTPQRAPQTAKEGCSGFACRLIQLRHQELNHALRNGLSDLLGILWDVLFYSLVEKVVVRQSLCIKLAESCIYFRVKA